MNIIHYQQEFLQYLKSKNWIHEPKNLYEPIDYILQLGGKRIRPVLTLMAADIFSSDYKKAMPAALAVEVAAALKMGAIVAETNEENANLIYDFGLNLGLAFQLQDDYLDTFGDPETFGKQVGGDIIVNKKTFLYLKCLEVSSDTDQKKLRHFYKRKLDDNSIKIAEVTRIAQLVRAPDS